VTQQTNAVCLASTAVFIRHATISLVGAWVGWWRVWRGSPACAISAHRTVLVERCVLCFDAVSRLCLVLRNWPSNGSIQLLFKVKHIPFLKKNKNWFIFRVCQHIKRPLQINSTTNHIISVCLCCRDEQAKSRSPAQCCCVTRTRPPAPPCRNWLHNTVTWWNHANCSVAKCRVRLMRLNSIRQRRFRQYVLFFFFLYFFDFYVVFLSHFLHHCQHLHQLQWYISIFIMLMASEKKIFFYFYFIANAATDAVAHSTTYYSTNTRTNNNNNSSINNIINGKLVFYLVFKMKLNVVYF